MPVDFMPGFDNRTKTTSDDTETRDRAMQREGLSVAIKSAVLITALSEAVLIVGLLVMRPVLEAAQGEISHGEHWFSALMPSVMFGMFGLAAGFVLGWRMTGASGLAGRPTWLVGAGAAVMLGVTGAVLAMVLY